MKIVNDRPPAWIMEGCFNQFRIDVNRTFWTYGDTIYNPGALELPSDIIAHEEQHARQQTWDYLLGLLTPENPEELMKEEAKDYWWRKYLAEPKFRMQQEAEAYGAQYKHFCEKVKDRNKRAKFLQIITATFAGPLYQLALTQSQAKAMVLVLSGQKKLEQVA